MGGIVQKIGARALLRDASKSTRTCPAVSLRSDVANKLIRLCMRSPYDRTYRYQVPVGIIHDDTNAISYTVGPANRAWNILIFKTLSLPVCTQYNDAPTALVLYGGLAP